jgi:predicted ATPase
MGVLSFLFTDIEGSTRLWERAPEAMQHALGRHDGIVRESIERHGGSIFSTGGDGFAAVFADPASALESARAAQARLQQENWPDPAALRVRMGIHTGTAELRDGNYFGPALNLCARLTEAGHGGQVLVSAATAGLLDDDELLDLGDYELRGIDRPVRILQVGAERFPRLRVVAPDRTTLPPIATPLIGRDDEVARVRSLLVESRLVTLTGVGGCGKTHLAVEVASQELPNRDAGAYFVDLSAVSDPEQVPVALAASLRLQVGSNPTDAVMQYLSDKNAIVVLDNCEHVIAAAAEIAGRFSGLSGPARMLATSRELLDVGGERIVPIGPLAVAGEDAPAVRLFATRAQDADPDFRLVDHVDDVAELCRHLDGMPLAIELAAARLAVMSPKEILARLDDRFRLLAGGRRGNRTRTLEATLAWSYDLLDDDEARFFRHLGVFPTTFDVPAASEVNGDEELRALDLLDSLVAKSMVVVERDTKDTRYRLLETLRAFAQERLHQSGDSAAARVAHMRHFVHRLGIKEWALQPTVAQLTEAARDYDNLELAAEWAVETEAWDAVLALAGPIAASGVMMGYASAGRRWIATALAHMPEDRTFERGVLSLGDASLAAILDDWPATLAIRARLVDSEHPGIAVAALAETGFSLWALGQLAQAEEMIGRAVVIEESRGPTAAAPELSYVRASLAVGARDFEAARDLFHQGMTSIDVQAMHTFHLYNRISTAMLDVLTDRPQGAWDLMRGIEWPPSVLLSQQVVETAALLADGDLAGARTVALGLARESTLGRVPRAANDALLGLAVVAAAEGDEPSARLMLQEVGIPRNPHTAALALDLADRLGIGDEYDALCADLRATARRPDARLALIDWLDRFDQAGA